MKTYEIKLGLFVESEYVKDVLLHQSLTEDEIVGAYYIKHSKDRWDDEDNGDYLTSDDFEWEVKIYLDERYNR